MLGVQKREGGARVCINAHHFFSADSNGYACMSIMQSKIEAGLLFQSRFEGMFPFPEPVAPLPEPPGTYPVMLDMIGAEGFRDKVFSSWSSFLTPFSVQMEVLYDALT